MRLQCSLNSGMGTKSLKCLPHHLEHAVRISFKTKKKLLPRSRCKKKISEDIIWEVFEILNLLTFPSGVPQPMLHSIEGIPSSGPRPVPPDIRKCQTAVLMDGTRHGMTVASAQLVAPPMSPQHFWWKPSFLTGSALHLGLE